MSQGKDRDKDLRRKGKVNEDTSKETYGGAAALLVVSLFGLVDGGEERDKTSSDDLSTQRKGGRNFAGLHSGTLALNT